MAPEQRFQQLEEALYKSVAMQLETQSLLRNLVGSRGRIQETISGSAESLSEENLDGLIRAITAEHGNGKPLH
jgi:hypothetical protein